MNQLIAKSTGEDINTNLLAVISTQESDMMLCTNWPLWIGSWQKEKEPYIWTAPISQTTLSQKNTFNGKCLVLAFCSRAVDFAAHRHRSSMCNIGWEQIIWKASNALCLCKLHEILTKLIYSRFFVFFPQRTYCPATESVYTSNHSSEMQQYFLISESLGQGVIIQFHTLCFLLNRSVPVRAVLRVEAKEP